MWYHKTELVPYGFCHFPFCVLCLIHLCFIQPFYFFVSRSHSLFDHLSHSLSFSLALDHPPPPPRQVQCRCSYLSIMKRGGGEHTAFVLNRGWIIHPVEECLSTLRVCVHTFMCVFVSACLNMVLLYIVVVCMEMFFWGDFSSPQPHSSFFFFCFLYVALWQMLSASMCCVRFILLLQGVIRCSKAKNTSTIISND